MRQNTATAPCGGLAMTSTNCHHEERSDVAISYAAALGRAGLHNVQQFHGLGEGIDGRLMVAGVVQLLTLGP